MITSKTIADSARPGSTEALLALMAKRLWSEPDGYDAKGRPLWGEEKPRLILDLYDERRAALRLAMPT